MRKNIFTLSLLLTILGLNACNSDKNNNKQENQTEKKEITTNNTETIVYVNSDSLIIGYEFYKKSVKEIDVKKK
jgi:uncharacterized protein YdaL